MKSRPPVNLNAKVVGFGKCGSRMCYDFFATSFGKPLSYELRTRQGNILVDYLQHRWSVAKYWTIDLFGTRAHPLDVEYSIVDSDGENEIVKFVAYAEENGKKESYAFNGDRLTLGQHGTGCDYGAVAEAITKEMLTRNNNQLASIFGNDATFRIWMTSIAGGTGSGSSLVILEQDRKRKRKNSTYHMVMGVLPAEPILVVNGDERSDPDRNEAINAGRFLVKWLASQTQAEKADALFLASNTTTKYINDQGVSDAFKPEALINAYCASVVFQIAEANSPDAKCSPDYDPVEMANRCTGCAVLVAKAFREIEESPDADQNRRAAKDLLSKAISNPTIVRRGSDEFLNGLSVPLRTKEINCLLDAIQKNDRIRASDRMPLPKEFQTAKTIVLLHGLSDNGNPGLRKEATEELAKGIFWNSDVHAYKFKTRSDADSLSLLVIDPYIRQVQRLIYAYISAAWSDSGLGDLGSKLDELLLGSKKLWSKETDGQLDSVDPALLKLIRENEDLSAKTLGETAASMITNNSHGKPLTRLCMARALEALRMQLSRQRTQIPQSTI